MSNRLRSVLTKLSVPTRAKMAKEKIERVVDHLHYLLALHENNKIVLYSTTLSSQIPTSYAANAFNVFQRGLYQFEILRLCALWDGAEMDKENIPTIIELIDHDQVIGNLAQQAALHCAIGVGHVINHSADPVLHASEIEMEKYSNEIFGQQQADRARNELRKVVDDSRAILSSAVPKRNHELTGQGYRSLTFTDEAGKTLSCCCYEVSG
jgi:hypothetical protein